MSQIIDFIVLYFFPKWYYRQVVRKAYDQQTIEQRVFVEELGWNRKLFADCVVSSELYLPHHKVVLQLGDCSATACQLFPGEHWVVYCGRDRSVRLVHVCGGKVFEMAKQLRELLGISQSRYVLMATGNDLTKLEGTDAKKSVRPETYQTETSGHALRDLQQATD